MVKKELLIIADYSQIEPLTFEEVCEICRIDATVMNELIENEIIHPYGQSRKEWKFALAELPRVKRALRLQRDLEMNFTAVAVLMDVLDQMDEMRAHMEIMKKHYF